MVHMAHFIIITLLHGTLESQKKQKLIDYIIRHGNRHFNRKFSKRTNRQNDRSERFGTFGKIVKKKTKPPWGVIWPVLESLRVE